MFAAISRHAGLVSLPLIPLLADPLQQTLVRSPNDSASSAECRAFETHFLLYLRQRLTGNYQTTVTTHSRTHTHARTHTPLPVPLQSTAE